MAAALEDLRSARRRLLALIAYTDDFTDAAETLDQLEQWKAQNGEAWATILDHRAYLHSRLAELEKLSALVSDFDERPRED